MNNRTRFRYAMQFRPLDRLPAVEWAGWWEPTIARWRQEGLPAHLATRAEICAYLGLDAYDSYRLRAWRRMPERAGIGRPMFTGGLAGYLELKPELYPAEFCDEATITALARRQADDDAIVQLGLEGFFMFPRLLMGIEPHLYSFYDQPDLVHRINQDLLEYNLRVIERAFAVCLPESVSFAEDISYNSGPMISAAVFAEFLAPYYGQLIPAIKAYGIPLLTDTDGDMTPLVPWYLGLGCDGYLPLERRAGVDILALREAYPQILLLGGFDKTVMHRGEDALAAEFERLLPAMRQGGYVPSVDHQTPPDVSLKDYQTYARLLREYCARAGGQGPAAAMEDSANKRRAP